jgi:hypothetical protein
MVRYRNHKNPEIVAILSQLNPIDIQIHSGSPTRRSIFRSHADEFGASFLNYLNTLCQLPELRIRHVEWELVTARISER